jgi:hypothetical protein
MGVLTALFGTQEQVAEPDRANISAPIEALPAAAPEPVHPSPYGEQAFGLTRFGDTWLNLNMLLGVEFNPADKCGCEVTVRDAGSETLTFHLSVPDAAGLREYMTLAAAGKVAL